MKSCKQRLVWTAALVCLSFFSQVATSSAATLPLNYPYGLALDAKGNLYVANTNSNNVLVYSPTYTQLTAKTITANVAAPTAVAIDYMGRIWVANSTTNSITQYSASGAQNAGDTITNGVSNPVALAMDGVSNLWVNNGYSSLAAYNVIFPTNDQLLSYPGGSNAVTGIATYQGFIAFGNNVNSNFGVISELLVFHNTYTEPIAETCFSMGFDLAGNLYCGNQDNSLTVDNFVSGKLTTLAKLPGFPTGMAVDVKRGRIYVSFGVLNEIQVYTLKGALLQTIQ